jgi:endonuclease/exonuclease/phosphatase family metal-dependent hydrolase
MDHTTVDRHLSQWKDAIHSTISKRYETTYHSLPPVHIGAIGVIILSAKPVVQFIADSISCGLLYSSLKGGVGVRFRYEGEEYTILNAHLAANEGFIDRRIDDSVRILKGLDFGDGYGVMKPRGHVFFMGDLNFRCTSSPSEDSAGQRLLLNQDELKQAMSRGECFTGFHEPEISFPQTFKYQINTMEYNRKRIPSWCDRILFLPYAQYEHKYDSIRQVRTSDHEPVYLHLETCGLPLGVVDDKGVVTYEDKVVDMSLEVPWDKNLNIISDIAMRTGLLGYGTTKGRVVVGLVVVFLLYFLFP